MFPLGSLVFSKIEPVGASPTIVVNVFEIGIDYFFNKTRAWTSTRGTLVLERG